MALRVSPREHLLHAGRIVALTLIYVLLGRTGPALIPMHGVASLVWPDSGVCLAALVLGGYRLWPGVAIGARVTELSIGAPPGVAIAIASGNTLEAVLGTYALRRIPGFQTSLDRLVDVLGLILLAGIGSSMIAATVGAVSIAVGHTDSIPLLRTWMVWWAGDLVGILVVAPLLLTWLAGPPPSTRSRDLAEATLVDIVLVGGSAVLFSQPRSTPWVQVVLPHVLFLPLLWAALRFGNRRGCQDAIARSLRDLNHSMPVMPRMRRARRGRPSLAGPERLQRSAKMLTRLTLVSAGLMPSSP